jgi:hypothetical protein
MSEERPTLPGARVLSHFASIFQTRLRRRQTPRQWKDTKAKTMDIKNLLKQKEELKDIWDFLGIEAPFPDKDMRLWLLDFSKEMIESAFKVLAEKEHKVDEPVKYLARVLRNAKTGSCDVSRLTDIFSYARLRFSRHRAAGQRMVYPDMGIRDCSEPGRTGSVAARGNAVHRSGAQYFRTKRRGTRHGRAGQRRAARMDFQVPDAGAGKSVLETLR